VNKRFILRIEKLALGGFGLGFHEGKAIFAQRMAVGDLAEVELVKNARTPPLPGPCVGWSGARECGKRTALPLTWTTPAEAAIG